MIATAAVVLLLTVTAPTLLYLRQSPLERAYYRLRLGMTKDEAGAIMGRQPDEDIPEYIVTYREFDQMFIHKATD